VVSTDPGSEDIYGVIRRLVQALAADHPNDGDVLTILKQLDDIDAAVDARLQIIARLVDPANPAMNEALSEAVSQIAERLSIQWEDEELSCLVEGEASPKALLPDMRERFESPEFTVVVVLSVALLKSPEHHQTIRAAILAAALSFAIRQDVLVVLQMAVEELFLLYEQDYAGEEALATDTPEGLDRVPLILLIGIACQYLAANYFAADEFAALIVAMRAPAERLSQRLKDKNALSILTLIAAVQQDPERQ
jgi:hypothetical protein